MDEVPAIDKVGIEESPNPPPGSDPYEQNGIRLMDAEATFRENVNREADQRHHLRIWAVSLASFVVLLLIIVLFWIVVQIPDLAASATDSAFLVALYVAPIAAISTLSVALLLAAFRGSKDGDDTKAAGVAAEGVRSVAGFS